MNTNRNFEDIMMSVVRILWDSDYNNETVAEALVDLALRLQLMREDKE